MHLLFSLLIFTSIGAGNRCLDVNIAVPGTFEFGDSTSSLSFIGPAVDTGIAALRANYPQFNWTATYVWDQNIHGCPALFDNVQNMLARWYYRERQEVREGIDAIITSGCTETLLMNQLAAAWNVLLITTSGSDNSIADRQASPTWATTTLWSSNSLVYCSLLNYMNWTRVYVAWDRNPRVSYYTYAYNKVMIRLAFCGIQYTQSNFSSNLPSFSPSTVLGDFNKSRRIMLYFGDDVGFRVFLTLRAAFRSVILLTTIDEGYFRTDSFRQLMKTWRNLSESVYNNTGLKFELSSPNLAATQIAFELAGKVINEAVSRHPSRVPTGAELAKHLLNRTYSTLIGSYDMTAYGHGGVRSFVHYFDYNSSSFIPFLKSLLTEADDTVWSHTENEGRWFEGSVFPADEPRCGYDGRKEVCLEAGTGLRTTLAISLSITLLGVCGAMIEIKRRLDIAHENYLSWWKLT